MPVWRLLSSRASLMRCASPPESVTADCPEVNVAESDVHQRLQLLLYLRDVLENLQCVRNRCFQQVGDRTTVVFDGKRFLVVAAPAADFAEDVDIRQEVHLDASLAFALAGFAAIHLIR